MTYVMSDIHGHVRRFRSVMAQLTLKEEDSLYILGDMCDRNYGGVALLQELRQKPNVHILYGNHEDMLRLVLCVDYDLQSPEDRAEYEKRLAHWYRNGGELTHRELLTLPQEERQALLDYICALPLSVDLQLGGTHYKLVHAAPPELFPRYEQAEPGRWRDARYFAVWKRFDAEEEISREYVTVFGHTPTRRYQSTLPLSVWYGEHRIGIDCGCNFSAEEPGGRLACLCLETGEVIYSEEP